MRFSTFQGFKRTSLAAGSILLLFLLSALYSLSLSLSKILPATGRLSFPLFFIPLMLPISVCNPLNFAKLLDKEVAS